jgi:hypothetical protein
MTTLIKGIAGLFLVGSMSVGVAEAQNKACGQPAGVELTKNENNSDSTAQTEDTSEKLNNFEQK